MRLDLRTGLFCSVGLLATAGLWLGFTRLSPLAGTWEDDEAICSFDIFGRGGCADKESGEDFAAVIAKGNSELTIGCYVGTYHLQPGQTSFVWRVTRRVSVPCEPPLPKWLKSAQYEPKADGTYLGSATYRRLKEMFADNKLDAEGIVVESNLRRARFGRGNIIRMGVPSEDEDLSLEKMVEVLEGDSYGVELETASALRALALAQNHTFASNRLRTFMRR